ncbi:MAG: hypothetical protein OXC11_03210, partial [Rhodospirillales bacterium]|nr:hypothetical protein [Rhodospirillales bacterium]
IPRVIVPARPGITNALGCMVADLRHDYVRTVNTPLAALDARTVHETLAEQTRQGREMLGRERVQFDSVRVIHAADMQFQGQSHILSVPLETTTPTLEELQALFEHAYWKRFEVELPEIRAVLVNLHTAVLGRRPGIALATLAGGGGTGDGAEARVPADETFPPPIPAPNPIRAGVGTGEHHPGRSITGRRTVRFPSGRRTTPILRRESLSPGSTLEGPAVIEQFDTTTVLPPGCRAAVDDAGNLIVDVSAA